MMLVAYYAGPYYAAEAARLRASCERFQVLHEITELPCTGSWLGNSHLRPQFLMDALERHDRKLLSVDADAVLHGDPLHAPCFSAPGRNGVDIAVHYDPVDGAMPGTLLVCPTTPTRKLLTRWIRWNEREPQRCDRANFRDALSEVPSLRIGKLPVELCFVFDQPRGNTQPVIEHLQASRGLRPLMDQCV